MNEVMTQSEGSTAVVEVSVVKRTRAAVGLIADGQDAFDRIWHQSIVRRKGIGNSLANWSCRASGSCIFSLLGIDIGDGGGSFFPTRYLPSNFQGEDVVDVLEDWAEEVACFPVNRRTRMLQLALIAEKHKLRVPTTHITLNRGYRPADRNRVTRST